jgi:membrane protease subunit HflK
MPWNDQGGAGPWGQRSKGSSKGPWGGGSGHGGGGGNQPPNLEDLFKQGQDKFKNFMPGGAFGGRGILIGVLLALVAWLATGAYMVRPNEVALNIIFGKYIGSSGDGLRYNLPYPIGQVVKVRVTDINRTEVGFRGADAGRRISMRDVIEESLMLTGDENIVDIDFAVQWQVDPVKPQNFVFNIQAPESTIKAVSESAMREVIGRRNIQTVLTTDRAAIETEVQQLIQQVLDTYGAGVRVRTVQLQKVDPPSQVIDAFRDVQAARQDQDRAKNEAETFASRIVPEARGQAARIVQEAEAYKERTVAESRGAASRFTQVLDEYKRAPDVTRERMFLETMERVFGSIDKTIIDQGKNAQGVVPYLPLNELQRRPSNATGSNATGGVR